VPSYIAADTRRTDIAHQLSINVDALYLRSSTGVIVSANFSRDTWMRGCVQFDNVHIGAFGL